MTLPTSKKKPLDRMFEHQRWLSLLVLAMGQIGTSVSGCSSRGAGEVKPVTDKPTTAVTDEPPKGNINTVFVLKVILML